MRSFTRPLLLTLGVLGLLLSFTAPAMGRESPESQAARKPRSKRAVVKPEPAVRVITAEELGPLLKPKDARPLLVNYWATWCDPCREEFPDLVKIDQDFRTKGLNTIAISLDDLTELKTEVPRFLRLMKVQMPVYLLHAADPEPSIKMVDPTWGGALPATFLYDARGKLVYKKFGRFDTAELRTAISNVMSEK